MKHRIQFETTHEDLHKLILNEIRQICMEHSVPLIAEKKQTSNILQLKLKAELRANSKLIRDNLDGNKTIEL